MYCTCGSVSPLPTPRPFRFSVVPTRWAVAGAKWPPYDSPKTKKSSGIQKGEVAKSSRIEKNKERREEDEGEEK